MCPSFRLPSPLGTQIVWNGSAARSIQLTSLVCRGMIHILAEGSARSTDSELTEALLNAAIEYALTRRLVLGGDSIVAIYRIGVASVIKIMEVKNTKYYARMSTFHHNR
ncbi:hypothetical protein M758_9G135300 [Ceratodon purpureus]|nr:hypothetical protein M758_9G135300 [Ceratodon purpureus]